MLVSAMLSRMQQFLPPFWVLQCCGWSGYIIAFFLTSVPYLEAHSMMVYRIVFTVSAFLSSLLLRTLCSWLWRHRERCVRLVLLTLAGCCVLGHFSVALAVRSMAWWTGESPDPLTWLAPVPTALNGIFVLLAWSAIYFGVHYYQEFAAERRRSEAAEALAREAQLRALQYQVQPHFLFNTLNAISTLVLEGNTEAATTALSRLGNFFRATLKYDASQQVSIADELSLTEQYLEIEQLRLGPKLAVEKDIDASLSHIPIPHLLLQPVVEDAIRHGIARRNSGGKLTIRTYARDGKACILIADNGFGSLADTGMRGVGLTNVTERLRQTYGTAHLLQVRPGLAGGCEVIIELPVPERLLALS